MISAENVNKPGSLYTEIKRQQSLMLGLERAYEKLTIAIATIHTTHVQEPGRKDVVVSSCNFAEIAHKVAKSKHFVDI